MTDSKPSNLPPALKVLRDAMAPDMLTGLRNTQKRIDAGLPATEEDRRRLEAEIEYWSAK